MNINFHKRLMYKIIFYLEQFVLKDILTYSNLTLLHVTRLEKYMRITKAVGLNGLRSAKKRRIYMNKRRL